jgi:hypothetical protein
MIVGNTGNLMASLNNLVLALIKQARSQHADRVRRWFAGHISQQAFLDFDKAMHSVTQIVDISLV